MVTVGFWYNIVARGLEFISDVVEYQTDITGELIANDVDLYMVSAIVLSHRIGQL